MLCSSHTPTSSQPLRQSSSPELYTSGLIPYSYRLPFFIKLTMLNRTFSGNVAVVGGVTEK